jgi:hypothetical protein
MIMTQDEKWRKMSDVLDKPTGRSTLVACKARKPSEEGR